MTERQREQNRAYQNSERGRAVRKAANERYLASIGGRRSDEHRAQRKTRYAEDEEYRKAVLAKHALYRRTPEAQAKRDTYERSPMGIASTMLSRAKSRAKKTHLLFALTKEIVAERLSAIDMKCERTGDTFVVLRGHGYQNPYMPSIDQIVPGKGYTADNIQIVVWWYNRLKGDLTDEEVLSILKQTAAGKV